MSSPQSPEAQLLAGLALSGASSRRLANRAAEAAPILERSETLKRTFSSVPRENAAAAAVAAAGGPRSVGRLLGSRLADLGMDCFFGVPGDFNLALLDELIAEPRLKMVSCCNELNAGYAADGFSRARNGPSALVCTFSVGGLSALNAVAGAYAEDHPVICIVGSPYSSAWSTPRIVHHTLGKPGVLDFELQCFTPVTCYQAQLRATDTPYDCLAKIDAALHAALTHSKPVYISIPSNFAARKDPAFAPAPVPVALPPPVSVPAQLEAAVDAVAAFLNKAVKPVLVCGAHMRSARARAAMVKLAEASGMPVAVMFNSKGLFPEDHPNYIGLFWASLSTVGTGEIVVSADAYLFAGPVFTDIVTAGFTHMIAQGSLVDVQRDNVQLGTSGYFGHVMLEDFLEALVPKLRKNSTALDKYRRQHVPPGVLPEQPADAPLTVNRVYKHLQLTLTDKHSVLVDAGDSWFLAAKLKLPGKATFEIQSLYASIGWSLPASMGYALASPGRRVVCIVGDGALQMTIQELSTILRRRLCPIIVISNNGNYTVESEIHDGPYNELKRWDYVKVAQGFDNGAGHLAAFQVRTEAECAAALRAAEEEHQDKCVLIECWLDPADCSVEVLTLGKLMAVSNDGTH